MLLSEHVYCVAITFKMTEWIEQQICIKFCIKLDHSTTQSIPMIQKAAGMGNWWSAALSPQNACSCLMQGFFVKHQITQVTQPRYSLDLVPRDFWLFPKLKSPFKGKRFQTVDEIQENTTGQLMVIGRTVWGTPNPKSACFEGDWGITILCTVFLVSCIFFSECLYFSSYMAGYLLDRPRITQNT